MAGVARKWEEMKSPALSLSVEEEEEEEEADDEGGKIRAGERLCLSELTQLRTRRVCASCV